MVHLRCRDRSARAITKFDVLVKTTSDAGEYWQQAGTAPYDINIREGYVISLENVDAGTSTVTGQVAMPGSVVPAVAFGAMAMGALVKPVYQSAAIGVVMKAATAADLAAGKAIGRVRVRHADRGFLEGTGASTQDVVLLHTGVL